MNRRWRWLFSFFISAGLRSCMFSRWSGNFFGRKRFVSHLCSLVRPLWARLELRVGVSLKSCFLVALVGEGGRTKTLAKSHKPAPITTSLKFSSQCMVFNMRVRNAEGGGHVRKDHIKSKNQFVKSNQTFFLGLDVVFYPPIKHSIFMCLSHKNKEIKKQF